MNPDKVNREKLQKLTDLPNIGKAGAADLVLLGIHQPEDLKDRAPIKCISSFVISRQSGMTLV